MILQGNPGWATALGGIIGALGNYQAGKTQAQDKAADRERQKRVDAQNAALATSQIAVNDQNVASSKAAITRADLDSAAARAHQAAADALGRAQFEYTQTHDKQVLDQRQQEIANNLRLGLGQIQASRDNAQLQANTSLAVAKIGSATQIKVTGMNNATQVQTTGMNNATQSGIAAAALAGENRRFDRSDATTRRGQDIGYREYKEGLRGRSVTLPPDARRDADFKGAKAAFDSPGANQEAIVKAFAVKWKLKPDDAWAYFER